MENWLGVEISPEGKDSERNHDLCHPGAHSQKGTEPFGRCDNKMSRNSVICLPYSVGRMQGVVNIVGWGEVQEVLG